MGACCGKAGGGNKCDELGGCVPTITETKVEKTDTFFNNAKSILEDAEAVRSGVMDTKARIFELTGQAYLEGGGNMKNALLAFAISAACDLSGDLSCLKLKVTADGVDLEPEVLEKLSAENREIFENFKLFIETCKTLPETSADIVAKTQPLCAEAPALVTSFPTDAKDAGLGPMDLMKATKATGTNSKNLLDAIATFVVQVGKPELVAEFAADVVSLVTAAGDIPNLKADVDSAKEKDGGKCDAVKVCREVLSNATKAPDADAEKAVAAVTEKSEQCVARLERAKNRKANGGGEKAPAPEAAADGGEGETAANTEEGAQI